MGQIEDQETLTCETCNGTGEVEFSELVKVDGRTVSEVHDVMECPDCKK